MADITVGSKVRLKYSPACAPDMVLDSLGTVDEKLATCLYWNEINGFSYMKCGISSLELVKDK